MMTKIVTYKCDICEIDTNNESGVIGLQTNRSDGKVYSASPEQCYTHVCKSCAYTIYKAVKENQDD